MKPQPLLWPALMQVLTSVPQERMWPWTLEVNQMMRCRCNVLTATATEQGFVRLQATALQFFTGVPHGYV